MSAENTVVKKEPRAHNRYTGERAQNIAEHCLSTGLFAPKARGQSEARACAGAGDADCVQMAADHRGRSRGSRSGENGRAVKEACKADHQDPVAIEKTPVNDSGEQKAQASDI